MKMKRERSSDSDSSTPPKRARNNLGLELRILIPSNVAGSIIGKGGSNITKLRSQHKATIRVPDCPGPERVISICAAEEDITFRVLEQIVPIIEDESKGRDAGNVEIRLLFHQNQVGGIIGKGGRKITELRDRTATLIKIYDKCCPRSTDRVVSVSGRTDRVLRAVRQIALIVNDSPITGLIDQYDPHNYDDVFGDQYGGYGVPRAGYVRPGLNDEYRSGGPSGSGLRVSEPTSGGPVGGGTGRDAGGGEDRSTTQVTIPKEYGGAVIGTRGSRIRRIREESGATIKIDDPLPGSSERIITITGTSSEIRMAQYLLQQSVRDHLGQASTPSTNRV